MVVKNLFVNRYHINENAWTEALMKFLANTNAGVVNAFFKKMDLKIRVRDFKEISFIMQQREKASIPDATICAENKFIVHFEVKTGERYRESQIMSHADALLAKKQMYKSVGLVVLTNDYEEPPSFLKFRKVYKKHPISIRFLPWSEVRAFTEDVVSYARGRIRFLAKNYVEFLNEEVEPQMKWKGFDEDFLHEWFYYYKFRGEVGKLVDNVVKNSIETYCRDVYKTEYWREPKNERTGRHSVGYTIYSKRKSYITVYAGFYGEDECLGSPILYISWMWSRDLDEKLKRSKSTSKIQSDLKRKDFVFENRFVEKDLDIRKLSKIKSTERQVVKIREFFTTAAREMEGSKFLKALAK